MIKIFKTKLFNRWAKSEDLNDEELCSAIDEIDHGLVEATLGAYLFKKRVAKAGQGKRGSYRTIIAFRRKERSFFLYGFGKGERSNIDQKEEKALKKLSRLFMGYNDQELDKAVVNGALIELECNNE